jgi:hypothetical protein
MDENPVHIPVSEDGKYIFVDSYTGKPLCYVVFEEIVAQLPEEKPCVRVDFGAEPESRSARASIFVEIPESPGESPTA